MTKNSCFVHKTLLLLIAALLFVAMTFEVTIKIDSPPSGIHVRSENLYIKGSISDKSISNIDVILDGATVGRQTIPCVGGYFDSNISLGAGKTSISLQAKVSDTYVESGIVVFRDCSVSAAIDDRVAFVNMDTRSLAHPVKIISGRSMVPLREFAGFFGAEVSWDEENREIVVTLGKLSSSIKLGADIGVINGQTVTCDPPATSIYGASYVPSRFFSEMIGGGVSWDGSTKRITIGVP